MTVQIVNHGPSDVLVGQSTDGTQTRLAPTDALEVDATAVVTLVNATVQVTPVSMTTAEHDAQMAAAGDAPVV